MPKIWTLLKIKKGFDKFYQQHNRLPTVTEIDNIEYLPSAKQIQRRFGGIEKIRTKLGYSNSEFGINFGKGKYRSTTIISLNKNALGVEQKLETLLVEKFGEMFVHTEKRYGDGKNRVDFYVYSKSFHFGIEVINPGGYRNMQNNINIKIPKYKNFPSFLIFLIANDDYIQSKIDRWIKHKVKTLPINSKIMNSSSFTKWVEKVEPYKIPKTNLSNSL